MPPVILEIIVNADKGIAELRQLDKTLSETTKATQQQTQAQKDATQSSTSFASSLAQSAKSAVGLAAGFAGVAGIATTLSAAATAATGFEAALNAINALGTVSAGQLSRLREQLLALPPALGSSTELAKGLYDILGANVPAENAITVLTRSAELAKGGLGNLDTAINAVTKSAAAFGIPLEQAQFVTDVFTQTVVKGQGRLEEFAQAFPQVAATAAATGATFIDTNAAIAVLTQTFKNADTAATGLNSFFQQLIQNSAKFAAEGINVKQVLAEEGLTGIFRRLNEVTGGSAERLKELINDSEGFRAALTLTGTQFETFNETVASYANVTGLAQQAASKNLAGATASWQTFINTLDRLVQEVAPPLLSAFTSLTGAAATLAADVTKLYRAFAQSETLKQLTADFQQFVQLIGQSDAFQTLNANLLATTTSAGDTYNAFVILDELLKGNVRPAIDFVTARWDLLNAAFDYTAAGVIKLGQYLVDGLITPLAQVFAALEKGASALGLADGRFAALAQASQQLSADLAQASATFQGMAEDFVLGTARLGTAQQGARAAVAATTQAVQAQSAAWPQQGKAASAAATQTEQLSDAQQALKKSVDEANTAASTFKSTLEKLKPGDVLKAIPTEELNRGVAQVTKNLEDMAHAGVFSSRQIAQAFEDAAQVMRERFGELPGVFQASYDAFLEKTRKTASDIGLIFARLGIETKETQQKTAADIGKDLLALLNQTSQAVTDSVELVKDATGQYRIQSKQAIDGMGQDISQSVSATTRDMLAKFHDLVEAINNGEFKQIPDDARAALNQLAPIAKQAGEGVVREIRDMQGNIKIVLDTTGSDFERVFNTIIEAERKFGNNLREHLSPALIKAAEDMGLLGRRTEEVETNTKGLSETAIQLGHYINELGKEVNAYGNAIATLTDETKKLMALKIDIKTPFGTTIDALQEQLRQANRDLLNLPSRINDLGFAGFQQQQKVLQDLIKELEKRIADLQKQQAGATGTGPGTLAPTGATGGSTRPTGGSTALIGMPGLTGPTGPSSGSVVIGGGTTTQRSATYNLVIQTQAQDAATLARDLVPYLRQADLQARRLGG